MTEPLTRQVFVIRHQYGNFRKKRSHGRSGHEYTPDLQFARVYSREQDMRLTSFETGYSATLTLEKEITFVPKPL